MAAAKAARINSGNTVTAMRALRSSEERTGAGESDVCTCDVDMSSMFARCCPRATGYLTS